jgi:pimeloyl-ACP methyl ester carboxylesterase
MLRAAFLAAASSAAAASAHSLDAAATASVLASLSRTQRYHAPVLDVAAVTKLAASLGLTGGGSNCTPTVLMHGLGDAGSNAGMQSLAKTITAANPSCYAVAVDVADGLFSFVTPMQDQTDQLFAAIRADQKLASSPEINLVGLSQGGLLVRAYAEQRAPTDPAVRSLVSICGVQNGVYNCPLELQIIPFVCSLFEDDPYAFLLNGSIPLSFSDYFVTFWDREKFLGENKYLPPLNNLLGPSEPNATRNKDAILGVSTLLLAQATQDTVVYPYQSEEFGGYLWTNGSKTNTTLYTLEQGEQWTGDLLGLRTLSGAGRLLLRQFAGDHLRFNDSWWAEEVLPYLI